MKSGHKMVKQTLLIVDDDAGIRSQLKWGIEGYEIITADNREAAILQFKKYQPPIVTLDLGLPPDADGITEGYAILEDLESGNQILVKTNDKAFRDNFAKISRKKTFELSTQIKKLGMDLVEINHETYQTNLKDFFKNR